MTFLLPPVAVPVALVGVTGRYPRGVGVALEDRLRAGDRSALRDLFEEFGPMVMGLCRRMVGNEAEDLAQQVFLDAWRSRHRFDPERGTIGAWLTGIARFKAIDHYRAAERRPSVPVADTGVEVASGEAGVERIVDQLVITRALGTLPDIRRQVVELGFYSELTHPEIAERLTLPLGTVKSHMRRGLEALQRELEVSRGR
ncbi:MAG: RNA polymerase sigma factor [Acidimicrobiales bacterium]